MKTLIDRYIDSNNFGRLLGMNFSIVKDGEIEYRLQIKPEHLATPMAAHGGVIAALTDAALGVAALSLVHRDNQVVSTVEYKLNFMSPALTGDLLIARARVEQRGKRIVVCSCDIVCASRGDKLIAKALGTFNCYEASKAGY